MLTTHHDCPLGAVRIISDGVGLTAISILRGDGLDQVRDDKATDDAPTRAARAALDAYFAGQRIDPKLPYALKGTDFQMRVWRALQEIPYGETISYGELARQIGAPRAVRALGAAVGRNPIWIFIPCHRVIGADGSLTGYAGGLEVKRSLLDLERGARLGRLL